MRASLPDLPQMPGRAVIESAALRIERYFYARVMAIEWPGPGDCINFSAIPLQGAGDQQIKRRDRFGFKTSSNFDPINQGRARQPLFGSTLWLHTSGNSPKDSRRLKPHCVPSFLWVDPEIAVNMLHYHLMVNGIPRIRGDFPLEKAGIHTLWADVLDKRDVPLLSQALPIPHTRAMAWRYRDFREIPMAEKLDLQAALLALPSQPFEPQSISVQNKLDRLSAQIWIPDVAMKDAADMLAVEESEAFTL